MRNFRYPAAIPPIQTPLVDPESGLVHEAWRRWFESLQIQAGGQGGDAIFDAELLALVQGSENAAAIEALSGVASFIETSLRAQQEGALQASEEARREIRQIADSLRAELEATLAGLGELARRDIVTNRVVLQNSLARTHRFDGSPFGEQTTTSNGIVLGVIDPVTLRGGALDVLVQARMGIASPTGSGLLRVIFIIEDSVATLLYSKTIDLTPSFTGSRDLNYQTIGFSIPATDVPSGPGYLLAAGLERTHSAGTLAIKDNQLRITEDATQT